MLQEYGRPSERVDLQKENWVKRSKVYYTKTEEHYPEINTQVTPYPSQQRRVHSGCDTADGVRDGVEGRWLGSLPFLSAETVSRPTQRGTTLGAHRP